MVKLRRDLVKLLAMCKIMKDREDAKCKIVEKDFRLIEARLQAEDYKNVIFKKLEEQKEKEQRRLYLQRQVLLLLSLVYLLTLFKRELADQRRSDNLARISDPSQSPPSKMAKLDRQKSKSFHPSK